MKEFLERNKKLLSKIIGILLIVGALGAIYWSTPEKGASISYGSSQSSSLKPVSVFGSSAPKVKNSHEEVMKAFEQRQEEQVQLFLILLAISGVIFVLYGFLKKDSDE